MTNICIKKYCMCTRLVHCSMALDYKRKPPISRCFCWGLFWAHWANSEHSLLDSGTQGHFGCFSSCQPGSFALLNGRCYTNAQVTGLPLMGSTATEKQRQGQTPSGSFGFPAMREGTAEQTVALTGIRIWVVVMENILDKQTVALNCNYFYCQPKDNAGMQSASFWLLSLKITARIHLSWEVIRLSLGRTQTQCTFPASQGKAGYPAIRRDRFL